MSSLSEGLSKLNEEVNTLEENLNKLALEINTISIQNVNLYREIYDYQRALLAVKCLFSNQPISEEDKRHLFLVLESL